MLVVNNNDEGKLMEPKYAKVYEALLERISGMSPGERLDSEVKLASSFKVSPMTVRRALMLLSQNGLTVGIPGRGTFVADRNQLPQQEDPPSTVASWNAAEYPQTHVKLVSATLEAADDSERKLLQAEDEPFVATIRRAHYLDETYQELAGIETALVRADDFPGILGFDLSSDLPSLLSKKFGEKSSNLKGIRTVYSRISTDDETKYFHLPKPDALLVIEASFRNPEGKTVAEMTAKFIGKHVVLTL